jgi:ribosome-binding factor A
VRELLKRTIGEVIRREISVEEAGLITVNDVGVSADLHSATVFVGIVGSKEQQKRGEAILQGARKRIQTLVGQAIVLKYTPVLRFLVNDSIEKGNRVIQIIEEIEKLSPEKPASENSQPEESESCSRIRRSSTESSRAFATAKPFA